MPAGRPTTYKPEYCEQIIAFMARGLSKTAFAGSVGTSRQTLIDWAKANPEFSDAVKVAEAVRTGKLEEDLLGADSGPKVTSRIFALKNACPDEWRDKVEHGITDKDGNDRDLGDTEFARRVAFLLAAGVNDGTG